MLRMGVALHPEGVDRNMKETTAKKAPKVALHPEGVDRNILVASLHRAAAKVALHPEGVDRNLTWN